VSIAASKAETTSSSTTVRAVPLWRVGVGLGIVNVTTYLAIMAVMNVLLPSQIVHVVGDAGKEIALGVITTVGAIVSMISSPVIGALSDRTRSRFGRRAGKAYDRPDAAGVAQS